MNHAAGAAGATEPVGATTPDSESDVLMQRRLLYAEKCENLMQALQFVSAVLRKVPAGGNDTRNTTARVLAERLPPDALEGAFQRIDSVWAAWTRPETGIDRNREAVQRHARMALLAAVDQTVQFLRLLKVTRALAQSRAGYAVDAEEESLAQSADAEMAAELLDGKTYPLKTLYGDLEYQLDEGFTAQTAADAELPKAAEIVRWLIRHNGSPELASKLTDEEAERLVGVWPKRAGRPQDGETASWKVISKVLGDLGLGGPADMRKDWESFRRENGMTQSPRSPKGQRSANR